MLYAGECRTPEIPAAKVIIVIVPNGTKSPSVTSPESGEEDGTGCTAELASSENFRRLHRALSAAADSSTTIVVATNTVPSTLDATCDKGASTLAIPVQLLTNDININAITQWWMRRSGRAVP